MTQPFLLKVTDGVDVVDLMGSDYRVNNGGFNIGLPDKRLEVAVYRPGPFFIPVSSPVSPRKAEIYFSVYGSTRKEISENLGKFRRILRRAEARRYIGAGHRVELQYAWAGTDQITYFEVYGGDVIPPEDVLSVEKVHRKDGSDYQVPDCFANLVVSPYGYGISPLNGTPAELPLINSTVGSKQTGGLNVQNCINTSTGPHCNWVEVAAVDIPGSEPYITKLVMTSDPTDWTAWDSMYIGLKQTPFATDLCYENDEIVDGGGTEYDDSYCSGKTAPYSYHSFTRNPANPGVQFFEDVAWEFGGSNIGMFYAFLRARDQLPTNMHFAIGIDDYTIWKIRYVGDFTAPKTFTFTLPLGPLQIPPGGAELAALGTLDPSLWMGLFVAFEESGNVTYTLDCLNLLPIDNGLRILKNRGALTGDFDGDLVDDAWLGQLYRKDTSTSKIATPMYGLMEPIKLEPGITQRLYFETISNTTQSDNYLRKWKVKLYAVPAYAVLAT